MGTTPTYLLPYPELADPADAQVAVKPLADRLEVVLPTLVPPSGSVLVGTYAARPLASAVADGATYHATDTFGTWVEASNAWVLVNQGRPRITLAQFRAAPFTTPYDQQEVAVTVDAAAGVTWSFKYDAASAGAKWEAIGGPPLTAYTAPAVTSGASQADNAWFDLAASPTLTVPLTGDYLLSIAVLLTSYGGGGQVHAGAQRNAVALAFTESAGMLFGTGFATGGSTVNRVSAPRTYTAADVLLLRYHATNNARNSSWAERQLSLMPVRVTP